MRKPIAQALLDTLELRKGSVITRSEIAALKKRWSPTNCRAGTPDRWVEYEAFHDCCPFQVDESMTEQGRAWWQAQCFTKAGKWRNTVFVRDNYRGSVISVLESGIARFELVDWEFIGNTYGFEWPFPVYRVYGRNGDSFVYANRPWQSGGECIIMA